MKIIAEGTCMISYSELEIAFLKHQFSSNNLIDHPEFKKTYSKI